MNPFKETKCGRFAPLNTLIDKYIDLDPMVADFNKARSKVDDIFGKQDQKMNSSFTQVEGIGEFWQREAIWKRPKLIEGSSKRS